MRLGGGVGKFLLYSGQQRIICRFLYSGRPPLHFPISNSHLLLEVQHKCLRSCNFLKTKKKMRGSKLLTPIFLKHMSRTTNCMHIKKKKEKRKNIRCEIEKICRNSSFASSYSGVYDISSSSSTPGTSSSTVREVDYACPRHNGQQQASSRWWRW